MLLLLLPRATHMSEARREGAQMPPRTQASLPPWFDRRPRVRPSRPAKAGCRQRPPPDACCKRSEDMQAGEAADVAVLFGGLALWVAYHWKV